MLRFNPNYFAFCLQEGYKSLPVQDYPQLS